jgi:hypothetical protein
VIEPPRQTTTNGPHVTESIAAPSRAAARAAARQLTGRYGARLTIDVEAALHAAEDRPQQYLDPVSLGGLLVSIATLAWTVYRDLKRQTPRPTPQVISSTVRRELRYTTDLDPGERDQIIDVVVTEILHTVHDEPPDTESPVIEGQDGEG